jgi:hypothetical protein
MCRGFGLCKHSPDRVDLKEPRCWSWLCEDCAPVRRNVLIGDLYSGNPSKFLTLTWQWREGMNPAEECTKMMTGFSKLIVILRKYHKNHEVEYFWVLEATKQGAPHLHIALRMPYTPKAKLIEWWFKLTGSYIVDIQDIRTYKDKVSYIAKYLGKDPEKFGTHKRYSRSKRYLLNHKPYEKPVRKIGDPWWERVPRTMGEERHRLVRQHHFIEQTNNHNWIAWKLGYWPCRAWKIPWIAEGYGPAPETCGGAADA